MRRRQRRLRAQWRHEQQTVAMVLATVGHHSFGPTANDALRSQKPVTSTREGVEVESRRVPRRLKTPPPGTRPERLVDARGLQGGLERAACPRSEAPPPLSHRHGADDDNTVAFLLTQSLRQRQEEVEDAAMRREEDVEEDNRPEEYFSVGCEFLEKLEGAWRSRGHGVARLLRGSGSRTTSSSWLVVLDSCFDLVEAGVHRRGRTPSTRAVRCALRRRSWLAGSTTSGRLGSEGLGIPSPHLGCHGGPGEEVSTSARRP